MSLGSIITFKYYPIIVNKMVIFELDAISLLGRFIPGEYWSVVTNHLNGDLWWQLYTALS